MNAATLSIVWIDQHKAKIFHFSEIRMKRDTISQPETPIEDEVAQRLGESDRILILGHENARIALFEALKARYPEVASRVLLSEYSDYPTDRQIAAYAIRYFQKPVA